jgi:hypothetical protein
MTDREKFKLPPKEATDYLLNEWGISRKPTTLAKLRCLSSEGPAFVRAGGAILYSPASLDEFARKLMSGPMTSTSSLQAA